MLFIGFDVDEPEVSSNPLTDFWDSTGRIAMNEAVTPHGFLNIW